MTPGLPATLPFRFGYLGPEPNDGWGGGSFSWRVSSRSFFLEGTTVETTWSKTQLERLRALEAGEAHLFERYEDPTQRDRAFQKLEGSLVKIRRRELQEMRRVHGRPGLCRLQTDLEEALVGAGFVQVTTPTILSRGLLAKMGVTEGHDLFGQVFWLDRDRCLRPMLAPHLYYLIKDLLRLWDSPVGIFEIGSCFRKESQGARHSTEFTMLNLCEFGLPEEDRGERVREMAELVTGVRESTSTDWQNRSRPCTEKPWTWWVRTASSWAQEP